jgi:hypothetical protein
VRKGGSATHAFKDVRVREKLRVSFHLRLERRNDRDGAPLTNRTSRTSALLGRGSE